MRRRVLIRVSPYDWDGRALLDLRAKEGGSALAGDGLLDFCIGLGRDLFESRNSALMLDRDDPECVSARFRVASGEWMDSNVASALKGATKSGRDYNTEVEAVLEASEAGRRWRIERGGRRPRRALRIDDAKRTMKVPRERHL